MPETRTRPATTKRSKTVRPSNTLTARLTALEARTAQSSSLVDARLAELERRVEALEKRVPGDGLKGEPAGVRVTAARVYTLERRMAELEAAMKLESEPRA